jgi:hypothetical protein
MILVSVMPIMVVIVRLAASNTAKSVEKAARPTLRAVHGLFCSRCLWLHDALGVRDLLPNRHRAFPANGAVSLLRAFLPFDARIMSARRPVGRAFGSTVLAYVLAASVLGARLPFAALAALRSLGPVRLAVIAT